MAGDGIGVPKASDGWCEALRHLTAARGQLVASMTAISYCMDRPSNCISTAASEPLREKYRAMPTGTRIGKLAACRPSGDLVSQNVLASLKALALSWRELRERAEALEQRMRLILEENARPLLDVYCMGRRLRRTRRFAARHRGRQRSERIRSEAAFAKLCGACPLPASSGKTNRHRLNRGGSRQGNRALHNIALVRMRHHRPTRDYVARKTRRGQGQTRNHAMPQTLHRARGLPGAHRHTQRRGRKGTGLRTRRQTARTARQPRHHPAAGRRGVMRVIKPHQRNRTRQTRPARTRTTCHPMDQLDNQPKTTRPNA